MDQGTWEDKGRSLKHFICAETVFPLLTLKPCSPRFWHWGRIQLPQLHCWMNGKSLRPVPSNAHHQRGSVTLWSRGEFPARLKEQSFVGEGQEVRKKHGLVILWAQEASRPNAEPWLIPVSMTFLQKRKLPLRENSPEERSCAHLCCHRCQVENWMEPRLLVSLNWNRLKRKYRVKKQDVTELLAKRGFRRLLEFFKK